MIRPLFLTLLCLGLAACAKPGADVSRAAPVPSNLYPGETPQMRTLVRQYAAKHDIPEALLHRVIQRESDYRPHARNGPYWGLMQFCPRPRSKWGFRARQSDFWMQRSI